MEVKQALTHTHTHTHMQAHTHTHAGTHTHTHTHTHTCMQAHTHIFKVFPKTHNHYIWGIVKLSTCLRCHRPQPTQCPHLQENEAGTITNLQLWSWRPDSWDANSAESKTKRVANSSAAAHQTLWQLGGTGENSHVYLADWTFNRPGY